MRSLQAFFRRQLAGRSFFQSRPCRRRAAVSSDSVTEIGREFRAKPVSNLSPESMLQRRPRTSRRANGVAAKMLRKKLFFEENFVRNSPIRPPPHRPAFSHFRRRSDLRRPLPTTPRLLDTRLYEYPRRPSPPNLSPSRRLLSNSRRRPPGFLFRLPRESFPPPPPDPCPRSHPIPRPAVPKPQQHRSR